MSGDKRPAGGPAREDEQPARQNREKQKDSTLAALLRDKRRRGRPPRAISRQNVYVELDAEQKRQLTALATHLPENFVRADVPDLAIMVLAARLEALRRAVSGRTREIPEGITDLESLYLLWDLPLPEEHEDPRWTSIRVSPQQAIDLGRVHGTLNVLFGATRSEVFTLALNLLEQFVDEDMPDLSGLSLLEMRDIVDEIYL
ncbi:MAG: hypothetical protein R3272_09085 [Candidatus Promineifilaceae bacterium]|nr:hypothetical protein [Candidatus Promineifilaceae bacterium]